MKKLPPLCRNYPWMMKPKYNTLQELVSFGSKLEGKDIEKLYGIVEILAHEIDHIKEYLNKRNP